MEKGLIVKPFPPKQLYSYLVIFSRFIQLWEPQRLQPLFLVGAQPSEGSTSETSLHSIAWVRIQLTDQLFRNIGSFIYFSIQGFA